MAVMGKWSWLAKATRDCSPEWRNFSVFLAERMRHLRKRFSNVLEYLGSFSPIVRSLALHGLGLLKEAKEALEKAVSLDPENQLYKNNLKLVEDAILAADAAGAVSLLTSWTLALMISP